jgi:hypothetical protein
MAREKCGLLPGLRTVPVSWQGSASLPSPAVSDYRNTADALTLVLHYDWLCMSCIVLGTRKDNYDVSAGFFKFNLIAVCHLKFSLMLSTNINITETTYSCQF